MVEFNASKIRKTNFRSLNDWLQFIFPNGATYRYVAACVFYELKYSGETYYSQLSLANSLNKYNVDGWQISNPTARRVIQILKEVGMVRKHPEKENLILSSDFKSACFRLGDYWDNFRNAYKYNDKLLDKRDLEVLGLMLSKKMAE